jgi:hypothetical protein
MRRRLSFVLAVLTVAAGAALLAVAAVGATGSGRAPRPPVSVAVFVGGTPAGGGCTGVALLHVHYERPGVALTVLAAELPAAGAGGSSLLQLADTRGPQAAVDALARGGSAAGGWLWFDREGLETLTSGSLSDANAVTSPPAVLEAARRLTPPFGLPPLPAEQVGFWRTLLRGDWRPQLRVVSFENYVLAGGHVRTDLSMQAVAALGQALRLAPAGRAVVAPRALTP